MELAGQREKVYKVRNDIHTMDQVSEYIAEEQNLFMEEDSLQYRFTLIPDFSDQESCFIFKCHHAIGDGLALIIMLGTMQDSYMSGSFIQTTSVISKCKRFILFLLKPFTATYAFLFFLFWSTDRNQIKSGTVHLVGRKNNAISKPFELSNLKRAARDHHGTLNDVVLALTSISIKEYLHSQNDDNSKSINMLLPFSLRALPAKVEQLRIENDITLLCFTLKLHSAFNEAMTQINQ